MGRTERQGLWPYVALVVAHGGTSAAQVAAAVGTRTTPHIYVTVQQTATTNPEYVASLIVCE